ncbi:MAG TPA: response regulator [Segeticoccus sp.]|uniref:response regulator transcription factor n=1 Tax=Segeticoccus sp. TaxID=2706531 RepID=UPI002D806E96|nr:response regulator [Segeticoccus sp.]HET8601229.1 response regulator [Segeticoccus sp.]
MDETGSSRVLVADDDADIRDLVVFKLEQAGHEVEAVDDGASALEAIRRDPPQLAVLDVMMPQMSGIDVLRAVREDPKTKSVKVILLTARSRDADVDAGFASGADDYVIKPFSPRELVHRINGVLARPGS